MGKREPVKKSALRRFLKPYTLPRCRVCRRAFPSLLHGAPFESRRRWTSFGRCCSRRNLPGLRLLLPRRFLLGLRRLEQLEFHLQFKLERLREVQKPQSKHRRKYQLGQEVQHSWSDKKTFASDTEIALIERVRSNTDIVSQVHAPSWSLSQPEEDSHKTNSKTEEHSPTW
jgi:hypothetical protein